MCASVYRSFCDDWPRWSTKSYQTPTVCTARSKGQFLHIEMLTETATEGYGRIGYRNEIARNVPGECRTIEASSGLCRWREIEADWSAYMVERNNHTYQCKFSFIYVVIHNEANVTVFWRTWQETIFILNLRHTCLVAIISFAVQLSSIMYSCSIMHCGSVSFICEQDTNKNMLHLVMELFNGL